MDIFNVIEQRRSVRAYDSTHRMSEDEVNRLISLTMLSPTAFNIQHWRWVRVSNTSLREQIKAVAWNQAQITDASELFVLCADVQAWQKDTSRYWVNAPEAVRDFMVGAIDQYYRGREQVQRDEAMRSGGIVAQTMMLAAKGMGYDTCPMDGFDFDAVAKLIQLPADHAIVMMIAVGKGLEAARPRAGQLPIEQVLIQNTF
jgi:nitroreductase